MKRLAKIKADKKTAAKLTTTPRKKSLKDS